MRTTPVVSDSREVREVELPDGYSRVWSGRINIGDLYLHWQRFWNEGKVDWVRLSAAKIIADGPYYDTPCMFGCLIRERPEEKGYPCVMCQVGSPLPQTDLCCVCVDLLYSEGD